MLENYEPNCVSNARIEPEGFDNLWQRNCLACWLGD